MKTLSYRGGILSRLVILLFASSLFSVPVFAQRTGDKSFFAGAAVGMTVAKVPSGTFGVEFGQYVQSSYWKVSLKMSDWMHPVNDVQVLLYDHIAWRAAGGYMYRVFGTHNRACNIYLGGQAYVGFNQLEAFRSLPDYYSFSLSPYGFICGVEPELEVEYFFTGRLGMICGLQCPITFISDMKDDLVRFTWSIGVRYNF